MSAAFTIRRATANNAQAIAATHCASWRTTYPGLIPETVIAQWADETARAARWKQILQREDAHVVWLAFSEEVACLGFASAGASSNEDVQTDGQLSALYLLQSAHGLGIGLALLQTAFTHLHALGHASVCVEVLKDNPAEKFYARFGGEHVFTTVFEMFGVPLTEHIYVWEDVAVALAQYFGENRSAPKVL